MFAIVENRLNLPRGLACFPLRSQSLNGLFHKGFAWEDLLALFAVVDPLGHLLAFFAKIDCWTWIT
jgi:hypothetical protein